MQTNRPSQGLAAIEVVVITCVALATFALSLPALHAAQIFAKRVHTENNLKIIGLATANYESANGAYPMSAVASPDEKMHGVGHSGFTALLPYLEQVRVYNAYNFDLEPWHDVNSTVTRTRINEYVAAENKDIDPKKADAVLTLDGKPYPGRNQFGPLHFGMNWGGGHEGFGDDFVKTNRKYRGILLTVQDAEGKRLNIQNVKISQITDGTSFTLAYVEKRDSSGWPVGGFGGSEFDVFTAPAYKGDDAKAKKVFTGSPLESGPRVAFADGSVRALPPSTSKEIWYALLTRDGGEPIPQNVFEPNK